MTITIKLGIVKCSLPRCSYCHLARECFEDCISMASSKVRRARARLGYGNRQDLAGIRVLPARYTGLSVEQSIWQLSPRSSAEMIVLAVLDRMSCIDQGRDILANFSRLTGIKVYQIPVPVPDRCSKRPNIRGSVAAAIRERRYRRCRGVQGSQGSQGMGFCRNWAGSGPDDVKLLPVPTLAAALALALCMPHFFPNPVVSSSLLLKTLFPPQHLSCCIVPHCCRYCNPPPHSTTDSTFLPRPKTSSDLAAPGVVNSPGLSPNNDNQNKTRSPGHCGL